MSHARSIRFGVALASVAFLAAAVSAAPPPRAGGRPAGPAMHPHSAPHNSGTRVVVGIGYGSYNYGGYGNYGTGLYSPLGYGLGYSPFGYSGLPYGGVGYGALGYGHGFPSQAFGGLNIPRYTPAPTYRIVPVPSPQPVRPEPQYWENPNLLKLLNPTPDPMPLPLPPGENNVGANEGTPATITVITNEGATVTFDGIANEQPGSRHSFTTKPIPPGIEKRVSVKVDGPGAPTLSIGVRSGEKATVDLRK